MKKIAIIALLGALLVTGCNERDENPCPPWDTMGKVERVYWRQSGKARLYGVQVGYMVGGTAVTCRVESGDSWAYDYFQVGDTVRTLNFNRAILPGHQPSWTEGVTDKPKP